GSAYLLLDAEHPGERVAFMLREAGVDCVVMASGWGGVLPDAVTRVVVDDPATVRVLQGLGEGPLTAGVRSSAS
ncbi:hypothetical protein SMC26_46045, partial [Actinomadura fulvescens]|uniref:hypothetical protein n=1 Tax=Actinomadura fulvescens TaxID=46160 RepID=UPI003978F90D